MKKDNSKINKQKGIALAMTIIIISMIGVLIQGVFLISRNRANSSNNAVEYSLAKQSSQIGLDCALYQIVRKDSPAGPASTCAGETLSYIHSANPDYDYQFFIKPDYKICADVYIKISASNYIVRSDGYNRCLDTGPDDNAGDFQSFSSLKNITYTSGDGLSGIIPLVP